MSLRLRAASVFGPLVKPRSIDYVPVLALTLSSRRYGDFELRQIAAQVHDAIRQAGGQLIGGRRREARVVLDEGKLAAYNLAPLQVAHALDLSSRRLPPASSTRPIASISWKPANSCKPRMASAMLWRALELAFTGARHANVLRWFFSAVAHPGNVAHDAKVGLCPSTGCGGRIAWPSRPLPAARFCLRWKSWLRGGAEPEPAS